MKSPVHSTLGAAAGSDAETINTLATIMYAGAGVIFFAVVVFVLGGIFSKSTELRGERWIWSLGLILPLALLTALLVYSIGVGHALGTHEPATLRIHVEAKQWWWHVRYESSEFVAADRAVLANELHIPVGRPVEILLTSDNVIHSFWVPALSGKVDMIPGRVNRLVLEAREPGLYRGQCAEYCGLQHALMAFIVVAEPADAFAQWLERQALPARSIDTRSIDARGFELFTSGGCAACHSIRGTSAAGRSGPDLTHVGSRHSLASGILHNHSGTLAGWIVAAQDIKPGSAMPSTNRYTGEQLRTLVAWLESLQ